MAGTLSAQTVDEEAEADGQRFVVEVEKESPFRIGALWFGEQGSASGSDEDRQGWP